MKLRNKKGELIDVSECLNSSRCTFRKQEVCDGFGYRPGHTDEACINYDAGIETADPIATRLGLGDRLKWVSYIGVILSLS